jgi:hypothetical protein
LHFPRGGGTLLLCRFNNINYYIDMQTLSEQELKTLAEKVKNGTASQDEEIQFLDLINQGVESLTEVIKNMPQEAAH